MPRKGNGPMSDFIKHLSEQRARAWEQAKELLDSAAAEGRDLTSEEQQTYDRINADIDGLRSRIDSFQEDEQRANDLEAALGSFKPFAAPAVEDPFRSFVRGETREFHVTPYEARDLVKGTSTSGGDTVPTGFYGQLWEHLTETATIAGVATVLNTAGGENFEIPITTADSTAYLTAEAGGITESDPAFAKRTLGAYKYAVTFDVSRELLEDTGVDLTSYFARQAGRALGNKLGADLATGDGSSKPYGVVTGATHAVTGSTTVSGVPTGDQLIDLYYSVIAPYRNSSSCVWLMSDPTAAAVRKIKDSSGGAGVGNYLWQPGLAGAPDTILGKRVVIDTYIADVATSAKSVIFGDLSTYVVRMAGGMRFERSDDFLFRNDLVSFRAIIRADGTLVDRTGSVKYYIGGAS